MFGGVKAGSAFVELSPDLSGFQEQLGTQMAPVTGKLGKFGKAAGGAFAAGLVAVGVGKALYDIGAEFDDAYDKIQTGTGATGQKLDGLKQSFKNVVAAVPAEFGDAADAITQLNQRLGITGRPLERISKQMLELSRITGTDLSENIEAVTRTFGDWGVRVSQQPAFLDKMFRASQRTGISVADLGQQMTRYGAPLRQMGFGFAEAAAMVGKFEKEGVNAQLVMGSLRIALGKMASEGVRDPSKALGVLTQQIKNAGSAGKANRLAIETFGARAGPDMAAAIREGRFEFGSLVKEIDKGKGTITGAGKSTMDFGESWKLFTNNLKLLVEPVATRVFSAIGQGMKQIALLMQGKGSLHDTLMQVKRDIEPLLPVFKFVFDSIKKQVQLFAQNFKIAFDVIRGIVLTISGLLKGDFGQMWRGIKTIFGSSLERLKEMFGARVAIFGNAAKRIARVILDGFSLLKSLAGKVAGFLSDVVGKVAGFGSKLFSTAKDVGGDIIRGVVAGIKAIIGKVGDAATSIANAIKEPINAVIRAWNDLEFSVGIPHGPDINVGTPNIGELARGTDFWRGGAAVVGEQGPELAYLPRGTVVKNAHDTQAILRGGGRMISQMGGGGGGGVDVTFNVETIGGEFPDEGHLLALMGSRLRAMGLA